MATFNGFETFGPSAPGSIKFLGSAAQEAVQLTYPWLARHSRVDVRMGGGNDFVNFLGGAPGAHFAGGGGTDRFWYYRLYDLLPGHTSIVF